MEPLTFAFGSSAGSNIFAIYNMPGKQKTDGKKKGKNDSDGASDAAPSALELSLRLELEDIDKELARAKKSTEEVKEKNDWLLKVVFSSIIFHSLPFFLYRLPYPPSRFLLIHRLAAGVPSRT